MPKYKVDVTCIVDQIEYETYSKLLKNTENLYHYRRYPYIMTIEVLCEVQDCDNYSWDSRFLYHKIEIRDYDHKKKDFIKRLIVELGWDMFDESNYIQIFPETNQVVCINPEKLFQRPCDNSDIYYSYYK